MCDLCHSYPHHPHCPNAPEPATVGKCFFCEEDIKVGDEFKEVFGTPICKSCVSTVTLQDILDVTDMTVEEVLNACGGEDKVAEL